MQNPCSRSKCFIDGTIWHPHARVKAGAGREHILKKGRRAWKRPLLPPFLRKGDNDTDSLGGKTLKVQDYGIDCLTLRPTQTCLPLAISHKDFTIKYKPGWRAGAQVRERPTQPSTRSYTLFPVLAKQWPGCAEYPGICSAFCTESFNLSLEPRSLLWSPGAHTHCPPPVSAWMS